MLCGVFIGSTAYVLTMDGPKLLWNAHTGHKYDVQDANCPLKSVGCIVNHENVRVVRFCLFAGSSVLWRVVKYWEFGY